MFAAICVVSTAFAALFYLPSIVSFFAHASAEAKQ
jgi:hypothetical protein